MMEEKPYKAYWTAKAVTMPMFYNAYRDEVLEMPEHKQSMYMVDVKTFTKVWLRFTELILQQILDGRTFTLPYRLGTLSIVKKKVKWDINKMKTDWEYYNETGKIRYHTNDHTNNFYYKWYYDKVNAIFKNKRHYRFYPTKKIKLRLNAALSAGKDYFER